MEDKKLKLQTLEHLPSKESLLYRYVTIDKLLDFLFNQRIPLVRLNVFEDKLEGASIQHLLLNLGSNKLAEDIAPSVGNLFRAITFNVNPTKRNSLRRQREIFQNTNFASCWYANDHESVAMWQIYSETNSVAIKIPFKNLITELDDHNFELSSYNHKTLKAGSVQYYRLNDLDELSEIIVKEDIKGFIKDYCFQHEQEFRIMLEVEVVEPKQAERKELFLDEQIDRLNKSLDLKIVYLKLINFSKLPFEIIFHPRSTEWHRANIREIIDKCNLPFKVNESVLKDIFI